MLKRLGGLLGGSVVEYLPLAQFMIQGFWDRVLHWTPQMEPASPFVSASLSLSLINKSKILKKKKEIYMRAVLQ